MAQYGSIIKAVPGVIRMARDAGASLLGSSEAKKAGAPSEQGTGMPTLADRKPGDSLENIARSLLGKIPGVFLLAMEGRAPLEWGAALAVWPLLKMAPTGDGHAVIVFPGLAAGDLSTVLLRNFLKAQGYDTYGWDLGLNFGPREGVIRRSVERVRQIHRDTGRKVSLIGWSLGGIYAREFAKALPDAVRSVITLGTPFTGDPKATNAWRLYEFASGHKLDDPELLAHLREAPPVPTTSVFSRSDGVVAWPLSLQEEATHAENIKVQASHIGLGMNPAALYAMADRLSQPEGGWSKFHRAGWRQWFYRDPARPAYRLF